MLHILVNAYAVSPTWGSEPGMGWNWVTALARYCRVTVITEGEWRREIEAALAALPQRANLRFVYNPVPPRVRRMCWNQGDWRFYWHYRRWQRRTLRLARQIVASEHVDAIHQLNMIGFREPGFLWQIKDVPFVWGPVGGMELVPQAYAHGEPVTGRLKVTMKNALNDVQRRFQPRVRKALRRVDAVLAATKGVQEAMARFHHMQVELMNETGCYATPDVPPRKHHAETFDILWVGKFDFRKQLVLALRVVAALPGRERVRLHVVGSGTDAEEAKYRRLAHALCLDGTVVWHGKVAHGQVLQLMQDASLFLFTSIMEGTPHVVLEAVQSCLPVVCFDACGQAGVVTNEIGVKIPLSTPSQSVGDFAKAIGPLMTHPERLERMRAACPARQKALSWDSKARRMVEIYNDIVNKYSQTHHYED